MCNHIPDELQETISRMIRSELRRLYLAGSDDLFQETWCELIARWHKIVETFDPRKGPFTGWLRCVVRNTLVDQLRKTRWPPPRRSGMHGESTRVDPNAGPEEECARRELEVLVQEILAILQSRVNGLNYQVFYQRAIQERTVSEIAIKLGLSSDEVSKRHERMSIKFRVLARRGVRRNDPSAQRRSESNPEQMKKSNKSERSRASAHK